MGTTTGRRRAGSRASGDDEHLAERPGLGRLVRGGDIGQREASRDGALTELPVAARFPLSDIVAAHQAAETGPLGKVLVIPS